MRGKTAWGFCNLAFEASRDECFPRLLRRAFFRLGVAWFWVALAREGRAREVWRDLRAQNAEPRSGGLRTAWSRCIGVLKRLLTRPSLGLSPVVPAWSLTNEPRMRGLGLGRVWAVLCPFCDRFHTHLPGEGTRAPPCCADSGRRRYVLKHAGVLPFEHRTRFCRSLRGDLPRLLQQWPEPATPLAAIEFHAA
jgi:hypothetical protein